MVWVESDLFRVVSFMAASSIVLTLVIQFAASTRGGAAPAWSSVFGVAALISVLGILFGKYGQNFNLPWQIYYTVPAFVTIFLPPIAFRFTLYRAALYVALAFASAPLIHAAFFYSLGWEEYMPFLRLPRLGV